MVNTELSFQKRVAGLGRKHAVMARGYEMAVRRDGLMVVRARRPARRRFVPLRAVLYLCLGFCAIKALMVTAIGQSTYEMRVAKLAQGAVVEQGGAILMQVDPVTEYLAAILDQIVR